MPLTTWPELCAQVAIAAAVGAGLVAACRWLRGRSDLCGMLVVAGLLLRATVILGLFWTSFLQLPMLQRMHSGDGFWNLAIDARTYYHLAFNAALNGLDTVAFMTPSSSFVKILAVWMNVVGASPASGPYMNLVLYVLLCVLTVAWFRPTGNAREDLPCAVTLFALSFSPILVLQSSQPLKDTLFVFLLGIVCGTAFQFLPALIVKGRATRRSSATALGTVAAFLAALYGLAGIRAYYVALAWSALALVLVIFAARQRPARLAGYAAVSVLLLTASWFAYGAGADSAYLNPYSTVVAAGWGMVQPATRGPRPRRAISEAAGSVLFVIDQRREGFAIMPGATNIVSLVRTTPRPDLAPIIQPSGFSDRLSAVTLGLALIFVPVSVLKALAIIDFPGGRGLLAITDADTLFMDLTIVAAIALVIRRRSIIRERLPYVFFVSTLGVAAALLVGYVVINVGTLFRLRLMVAVPFWMLPLALSTRAPAFVERPVPPDARARTELLDLLICPACALPLRTERDRAGTEALRCARCGLVVPIRQGIPRFSERLEDRPADPVARLAARTQASFGYEWTHFHRWNDSGEISFRDYFETANLSGSRNGLVLDAGCGMGRAARLMAAHARHVIAVDFSRAIDQAAVNTRGVGNVDCVQADLLRLPFPDASFDFVYCLGVLHHLANTETAVRALAAKVKPGGRLRIYLYWKRHGWVGGALRFVNAIRPVTTRLPFWLLRRLCWTLSVVLWIGVILPYRLLLSLGVRGMADSPLFVYAKYPFRILYNDQFDRFSAPLEKRYDPEEVTALLESAGLHDVRVEARFGWIAEGTRPA